MREFSLVKDTAGMSSCKSPHIPLRPRLVHGKEIDSLICPMEVGNVSPRAKCSPRSLSRSRLRSVSSRARSESYPPRSVSSVSPRAKRSHRSLSRSRSRSVSLWARSESYPSCSVSRFDQDPGLHWRLLLAASGRLEAQCTVAAGAEAGVFLGLVHLMHICFLLKIYL
ncbi:hypothetical protein LguiB_006203 [Lonicera macranthoides]